LNPFDEARVRRAVTEFCVARRVHTRDVTVVPHLDRALAIAALKGPDTRWRSVPLWTAEDDRGYTPFGYGFNAVVTDVAQTVLARVLELEGRRRGLPTSQWTESNSIVPASRWARFSRAMEEANSAGLGWLLPVRQELLLVPMPLVHTAEGQPSVLHDDTGRPAVEWSDGSGSYFLRGIQFDKRLYFKVIGSELLIQDVAILANADQRSVALTYLSFERLVLDSDAELIDVGIRGTRLYRLPLPFRIRLDRVQGYGSYDYFIHMRDASHPERQFIEWVDPTIGRQRNAELCQAHAFGISLGEWLSIGQEG
jgi:hypothetical protein